MINLFLKFFFFQDEFYGCIFCEKVEELFLVNGLVNGCYLVCESNSFLGDYSLLLSYGGYILYYRLKYENEKYFIDDKKLFFDY